MERRRIVRAAVPLAIAAWGTMVGAGLAGLHRYESTPGRAGEARPDWPAGVGIAPVPGRPNLLMFAHPRCPCTRASVEALGQVLQRSQGAVAAQVLFYQPPEGEERWEPSALQRKAAAIPGVRILDDPGGTLAARFGAATSGDVRLYDRAGSLVFAGGITAGRGRAGGAARLIAVLDHLSGDAVGRAEAPVFGCPIRLEAESTQGGLR